MSNSTQNKKSVCIIDDDSIYLMLVNRIISMNRLSDDVVEFDNGKDAFGK
jgi:response regulator RpfG family c-di-GMP phosphodiesterase